MSDPMDDDAYQEYLLNRYSFTCTSDFPVMGYQPGEKICTMVRVLCTLITVRYERVRWLAKARGGTRPGGLHG